MLREHEIEIRVRYQETDAQSRVHHANYFTYFEMGRTELLRANGMSYRQMEEEGWMLVGIDGSCKYRQAACYDDVLRLRTTVTEMRGARVFHEYRVFKGDTLVAEGKSCLACIGRNGIVRRLPESVTGES